MTGTYSGWRRSRQAFLDNSRKQRQEVMNSEYAHKLFELIDGRKLGYDLIAATNCPTLKGIEEKGLTLIADHGDFLYECQDSKGFTRLIKGDENNQNGWVVNVPTYLLEEQNDTE